MTATMPARPDVSEWQERTRAALIARGIDPDNLPAVPDGETPEDVEERRRVQAANRAARWTRALPVMYADARLTDLDGEQHADAVTGWLDSPALTLLLAGTVGSGKTHAAYAVGHAAVARGLHVEAVTLHDLLAACRPEGDRLLAENVALCDVLVLDDLGATKVSDWAVETLTALMDRRLREGKRQVITTNSTSEEITEAWGGRLMDRLRHRSRVLLFRGASRRGGW